MPWKIHSAEFEPGNPFVRFYDPSVDLYLTTSLSNNTVETWIGDEDPTQSRLFIRITDEGAGVERASGVLPKDILIMDSVLKTLGASPNTRKKVLDPVRKGRHDDAASCERASSRLHRRSASRFSCRDVIWGSFP